MHILLQNKLKIPKRANKKLKGKFFYVISQHINSKAILPTSVFCIPAKYGYQNKVNIVREYHYSLNTISPSLHYTHDHVFKM